MCKHVYTIEYFTKYTRVILIDTCGIFIAPLHIVFNTDIRLEVFKNYFPLKKKVGVISI